MRRVYVCSPLRGLNGFTTAGNIAFATKLCEVATRAGYAAFAPHVFYPIFLDDSVLKDHQTGMQAGLAWLRVSDELWVYAEEEVDCSDGMKREIEFANKLNIPPTVIWMPPVWKQISRAVS